MIQIQKMTDADLISTLASLELQVDCHSVAAAQAVIGIF